MRIIIEDTHSTIHTATTSPVEPTNVQDGGAAPEQLLQSLAGVSALLPTGQFPELQDAGPPPAWLIEAVGKAREGDQGKFEFRPPSGGEGEPIPDVEDGGSAPDLS